MQSIPRIPTGVVSESPLGGAFPSDAQHPPVPPIGAVGFEIMDDAGNRIACGWVVKPHANERFLENVWSWYEEFGMVRQIRPSLELMPGIATPASVSSGDRPNLQLASREQSSA